MCSSTSTCAGASARGDKTNGSMLDLPDATQHARLADAARDAYSGASFHAGGKYAGGKYLEMLDAAYAAWLRHCCSFFSAKEPCTSAFQFGLGQRSDSFSTCSYISIA